MRVRAEGGSGLRLQDNSQYSCSSTQCSRRRSGNYNRIVAMSNALGHRYVQLHDEIPGMHGPAAVIHHTGGSIAVLQGTVHE